jgi:hypothetical protein
VPGIVRHERPALADDLDHAARRHVEAEVERAEHAAGQAHHGCEAPGRCCYPAAMARRRKLAARRDAREGTLGEWLGSVGGLCSPGSARKLALERPGKDMPRPPISTSQRPGRTLCGRRLAGASQTTRQDICSVQGRDRNTEPGNRFAVSAGARAPGSNSTIAAYAPRAQATRGDTTVWIRARQRGSITAPSAVRIRRARAAVTPAVASTCESR